MDAIKIYNLQLSFYNGNKYEALRSLSKSIRRVILSEYKDLFKDVSKRKYYRDCWNITEHNKSQLSDIQNRSFRDYHIDHIVPISYGFKNGINPNKIGSIENLRVIKSSENCIKGTSLTETAIDLLKSWGL